jgi:hypothetical protein
MKNIFWKISILPALALVSVVSMESCTKDLNRFPSNSVLEDSIYSSPAGYKQALANVYAGYTLTGNSGPSSSDIAGVDAGTSDFIRCLWNCQELTTDEAVCAWGDPGVPDLHNMSWTATDPILIGLYSRCLYQITLCNDFINHSSASAVAGHNITGTDATAISQYRAEARFLRAYQYSILMDLFGNPPFVTDSTAIGPLSFPKQIDRADLFNYVESELLACSADMVAARANEYGRADQGAAWALLARIYLNAEVYTGTARYTDAITYASKVINAGYSLMPFYSNLFKADNNLNNNEQILSIPYDGVNTQTYGGSTFLVNSAVANSSVPYVMHSSDYGVPSGGWGGNRATDKLPGLFPTPDTTSDKRAIFLAVSGVNPTIQSIGTFSQGTPVVKWSNLTSQGVEGTSADGTFCSADFPIFRLAEEYLIYAEAVLRGGAGGDIATATGYMNDLRQRAYHNGNGQINTGDLTLSWVLDERGRELYWECQRRSDLIRYGLFTTAAYLWPWKGGVSSGTAVDSHLNLFPLPNTDLQANSNLVQNKGY